MLNLFGFVIRQQKVLTIVGHLKYFILFFLLYNNSALRLRKLRLQLSNLGWFWFKTKKKTENCQISVGFGQKPLSQQG